MSRQTQQAWAGAEHGQGWFRTTVKWSALGWSYTLLLGLGLPGLVAAAVLV